jgi:hypothetical protein
MKKHVTMFVMIASLILIMERNVYSFCVETNPGDGSFSDGKMPRGFQESLLSELASKGSGTYMFKVQNKKGFYGKVCNEDDQIRHFMETYTDGKGDWKCKKAKDIYKDTDKDGIYRINKAGNLYEACVYAQDTSNNSSDKSEKRPPTEDQKTFTIKDKRLLHESGPDPCHTDANIKSVEGGYQMSGIVHRESGKFWLWCNGAKHKWIGRNENIEDAIAVIDSDEGDPLQFKVDKEKGYVYQSGKGSLIMPDGKTVKLPISRED